VLLSPFLQPHVHMMISPTRLVLPQTKSVYVWDNLIDRILSNFKRKKIIYEPLMSHLTSETDLHSRELTTAHDLYRSTGTYSIGT